MGSAGTQSGFHSGHINCNIHKNATGLLNSYQYIGTQSGLQAPKTNKRLKASSQINGFRWNPKWVPLGTQQLQYPHKCNINVQCCPTLDEPENVKLMSKNAKIYSAPGLKTKTFYKTVTRTPKHKKLQSRLLTPSAPTSMLGNLLGEQTMLLQTWFFIYPAEKTSCGNTFQH